MSISIAALRMMIVLKKLQHHICRYVGYNFHILSYYAIFEVCMCVKTRFYTRFFFTGNTKSQKEVKNVQLKTRKSPETLKNQRKLKNQESLKNPGEMKNPGKLKSPGNGKCPRNWRN